MMKKLGMVITCLVMILLLVSCANKRNDLVLSNFPSIQNELTEKDLLKHHTRSPLLLVMLPSYMKNY